MSDTAQLEQETTEAVSENRQNLNERLQRIREDGDLSDSAKERLRNQATQEASERHSEIVGEYERSTAETLEQNEQRIYKLSYPADNLTATQKEAFRASYRDSTLHCLNLPEADLERMMRRAQLTGDRALEQACYAESVDRGLFGVANAYRDRHPEAREAWETYSEARRWAESNEALLGRALLSAAGNPGGA